MGEGPLDPGKCSAPATGRAAGSRGRYSFHATMGPRCRREAEDFESFAPVDGDDSPANFRGFASGLAGRRTGSSVPGTWSPGARDTATCPSASKPARKSAKVSGRVVPIHRGKTLKVFSLSTASWTHCGVEGISAARAGSTTSGRSAALTRIQWPFTHGELRILTKLSRLPV